MKLGFLTACLPDEGWWRYRVPGPGDVDWRRLVDVLVAYRTLSPLIIA